MATITTTAGDTFTVCSPVDDEPVSEHPAFTSEAALEAACRAADAQQEWSARPFPERRRILLAAADLLESDANRICEAFAAETGSVTAWAEMNIHEAAATLREAAGLASAPVGELLPSQDAGTTILSERMPAGVALAIVPWNAPMVLAARSIAIALAVGNAVVIRPSERSPRTAGGILAEVLVRAGVPAEAVPVVTTRPGDGRAVIGALIASPWIARVVFIGSTSVGRSVGAQAGEALIPSVLELGGKNATIVRADADLDVWIPKLAFSAFANSGQVCMCTERIIVHESIADELVAKLAELADAMTVGDPRGAAIDLGPVISDDAARHFDELVTDATFHGARVVAGGTRHGRFVRPTVLTGVAPTARLYDEEGFLPIVSIHPFRSDDEAVAIANSGEYGLIASVVSADAAAAQRIARRVRAGAVHVNGPSVGDEPHVPFGGLGASGTGRLGGYDSVRFFTEQRTFYIHD